MAILSKSELEYLRAPEAFNAKYSKVLRHRIKSKASALREELSLLANAQFLTQNCNPVTEFRNLTTLNCNHDPTKEDLFSPAIREIGLNQRVNGSGPSRIRTGDLWLVKPTS